MSSGKFEADEKKAGRGGEACAAKQAGRPRCEATHRSILRAAREMIEEVGFECLTIEGVALRAGVGKTTIYRRWTSKSGLVLDALFEEEPTPPAFPDTGNAREDLRRGLRRFIRDLNGPLGCKVAALLAVAQFDDEMGEAFRARWIDPRRVEARRAVVRGVARGEIDRDADPDALVDALYGGVIFRLLAGHAPLTPGFADALIDLTLGK